MIDGDVARVDPTDGTAVASLQWKRQALAAEPEPDAACRSEFGEASKDSTDSGADRLIWMEADLAILLAPDETNRQAAPQFAAGGLVEIPPLRRARMICNSASLMVPLRPSSNRSLNIAG